MNPIKIQTATITRFTTANPSDAYVAKSVPSERVEISYAMTYPGAISLKIIFAQVLIAIWRTSAGIKQYWISSIYDKN